MAKSPFLILVVDDDPTISKAIRLILPQDTEVTAVYRFEDVPKDRIFHGAFVDMHLKGSSRPADGPKVIASLKESFPHLVLIGMSGQGTIEVMEESLRSGAFRFLTKPLAPAEVQATVEKMKAWWELRSPQLGPPDLQWVGQSTASVKLLEQIVLMKGEKGPLLIEGETGSGKEVVFELLNRQERNRPAVKINVASIPENLFESELFGHVKGAFTGADQNKMGLFECAQGGDLFLDEIEALPLSQQAKILRFLETGEIRRVGGKESQQVQTRVICATNQSLSQLVHEKKFREDLMFRLEGKKIVVPSLRERQSDIPELANYFLNREKPRINKSFSEDALEHLRQCHFPGNTRELKRWVEILALRSPLPIIRKEDLLAFLPLTHTQKPPSSIGNQIGSLQDQVQEFEKRLLLQTLAQCDGDVEKASGLLQVSRSNLYKKLKDYEIKL